MRSASLRFVAILALVVASPLPAEDGKTPPSHCQSDPRHGEFDFWLGTWDVYVDDKKAGENVVTKEEGGCLILEKWTDVNGGTGQSYNFYDPQTEKWRQVWVSKTMMIDYSGGLTEDGSMELIGKITYFKNGKTLDFLGRWTLQGDGSVRQYFEQYEEDKGKMVPIFTGIYRRKG